MPVKPLSPTAMKCLRHIIDNMAHTKRHKITTPWVKEVVTWCCEYDLLPAHTTSLHDIIFTSPLLDSIQTQQRLLGHPDIALYTPAPSRMHAAGFSVIEHKGVGKKPRQDRALVRLSAPVESQQGMMINVVDVDVNRIPLAHYNQLVVVENLDCFYDVDQFTTAIDWSSTLVIYRGDRAYADGAKQLVALWQQRGRDSIYFGDFDIAGVLIALRMRASFMLLPAIDETVSRACEEMLPHDQLRQRQQLEARADSVSASFLPYCRLLLNEFRGIRQQNMQGIMLSAVPLQP